MSDPRGTTAVLNVTAFRRAMSWYAKRVLVMDPAELCHRVGEHLVIKRLQFQYRFDWPTLNGTVRHGQSLAFCTSTTTQLPTLPWSFERGFNDSTRLLDGKLAVLGCEWQWRADGDVWHEAPDTGQKWPRKFFGQIPYRAGNPYGDVRVAWEASRLQQLVSLGLLAQRAEPEIRTRAVAVLETQFLSWIEGNPLLTGIHYISVMECGLRILAVCHALDLVRGQLQDPDRVWPALVGLVHGHAELIRKRLSIHSSAGNHTIAEAAGLVYAGSLFPELPEAQAWRSAGLSLLEQEAPHQILSDGGGAEQTFWYQRFISDLYGLAVALLKHRGGSVSTTIENAFHRSRVFLDTLGAKDDQSPSIGDGDGGYALSPFLDFSTAPKIHPAGLTSFEVSGYSVVRSPPMHQQQVIFDHGPLGLAPCFAHGHADALSVTFKLAGQDVLLDPGTYTYTGGQVWRNYFRGTRAHNTVVVDHSDQAVQETPFMWSQPFHAQAVISKESTDGGVTILAYHNGYTKRTGVTHWRAVLYAPPCSWLVWDRLTGDGMHHVELNWHLGVAPCKQADHYVLACEAQILSLVVKGGTNTLHCGEVEPMSGWRSPRYGVKESISTLRTEYTGSLPHEFTTHIYVGADSAAVEVFVNRLSELRRLIDETTTR
jgi:hypothetical protein